MIHYNGKPWKKSLDALCRTVGASLDDISDKPKLEKLLIRDIDVFFCICPYSAEIDEKIELIWDKDHAILDRHCNNLRDDI